MSAWSLNRGCGTCPSTGKQVIATAGVGGYSPFVELSGVYLAGTGWTGTSAFTAGQYVKKIARPSLFQPASTSLITPPYAQLYGVILDVSGAGDPTTDTTHFALIDYANAGALGYDLHNINPQSWSSIVTYASQTFVLSASYYINPATSLNEVPSTNPSKWEPYRLGRLVLADGSSNQPVQYETWTQTAEWEFPLSQAEAGFEISPASGSVTTTFKKNKFMGQSSRSSWVFQALPVLTRIVEGYTNTTTYPPFSYPNIPISYGGLIGFLYDFNFSATSQTWEWRWYSSSPQPYNPYTDTTWRLSQRVIQTINLSDPLDYSAAAALAQSMIDSVSLSSLSWGQRITLSLNSSGSVISSSSGGVTKGIGTNYELVRQASKGKGAVQLIGRYCDKEQLRGSSIVSCSDGDAGCAGNATVNPPGFDGDHIIEGGCTCPP